MPAVLSVRVIKRKIRSVGNIKKITRAMQMVSAAKLKKVQERLMELRPYADRIREFLEGLAGQVKALEFPLFQPRKEVKSICAIVMAADKGLCGSYNANLLRFAQRFLDEKAKPSKIVAVGRKSADYFRKQSVEPHASYIQLPADVPFAKIKEITQILMDLFLKGGADEVYLIFTRYVNALTFQPGVVRFLPIEPETKERKLAHEYEFEPEPTKILQKLTPRYVEVTFHRLLLESFCSEHAARMNAMRNATDNASDLIDSLTLQYNKARQAGITKELLDIVGGAEALKG